MRRTIESNLVESLAVIIRQVNSEDELVTRSDIEEQISDHVDQLLEDRLHDLLANRVNISIQLD